MRPVFTLRNLRAAHITIPVVLLAAPASALALSQPSTATPAPGSLPMRVSPHAVALGRSVAVTGHSAAGPVGTTVELQSAPSGTGHWRQLATTRVGPHGGWTFHTRLRESSVLRAVEVASATQPASTDATGLGGAGTTATARPRRAMTAVSRATPVAVRARLQVPARQRSVVSGQRGVLTGHLLPGRSGRLVAVQARSGSRWHTIGRGRTGRYGGFRVAYVPPAGIGHGLRVVFSGDRLNAAASMGAGSVTLYTPAVVSWYDDAGDTACGFHAGFGVANRTLPCGTRVRFRDGDRTVTATVDDRGPYVYSREYDLDQSTAAALGFDGVGTVQTSVG